MPGGARGAERRDAFGAMRHAKPVRRRCVVCHSGFTAAASAQQTQLVCGAECRKLRNRALARARRAKAVERYREDERERKRKCRQARREGGAQCEGGRCREGPGRPAPVRVTGCHAPPSLAKGSELNEKLLETWDRLVALSRATLEQELSEILGGIEPLAATTCPPKPRCHAPP